MITYEARPYGVYVSFITSKSDFRKCYKTSSEGYAGATDWVDGELVVFVGDGALSTLVHECVHASLFILNHVGIDPSSSNGEAMAYLTDNMFAYFMEAMMATKSKHPGFASVQNKIAKKEGVSKKAAGAILASATRNASKKAKKANPKLNKVKGK